MISVKVIGVEQFVTRLQNLQPKVQESLRLAIGQLGIELQTYVKANKLNGQVLKNQTHTLSRSINMKVKADAFSVVASVGTNIRYAAIHEFGGQTKPHLIQAKNAAKLKFMGGGGWVFRKEVNHPGSRMPERSFLRSALKDMESQIQTGLKKAVDVAVKK